MKQQYKRTEIKWYYSRYSGDYIEYGDTDHYIHRYSSYHRHPKTTHERRWNEAHKEFVRAKRKRLPQVWDDLCPSFAYGKCWKRFTKKRKQYS